MVLSTCIVHRIFNCILFKKRKAGISAMLTLLWGIDFINNTVPLTAVFQAQWLCFSKSPFGDLKLHVWGCYWTYLLFVWKMLHKKVFVCRHIPSWLWLGFAYLFWILPTSSHVYIELCKHRKGFMCRKYNNQEECLFMINNHNLMLTKFSLYLLVGLVSFM